MCIVNGKILYKFDYKAMKYGPFGSSNSPFNNEIQSHLNFRNNVYIRAVHSAEPRTPPLAGSLLSLDTLSTSIHFLFLCELFRRANISVGVRLALSHPSFV